MTKRDFEAMAKVVTQIKHTIEKRNAAQNMAGYFRMVNPRFDETRFYKACGFESWDIADMLDKPSRVG